MLIQERYSVQCPRKITVHFRQTLIYGWNSCPCSNRSNVFLSGHMTAVPREQSVIEGGVTFLLCSIFRLLYTFLFLQKKTLRCSDLINHCEPFVSINLLWVLIREERYERCVLAKQFHKNRSHACFRTFKNNLLKCNGL